MSETLYRCRDCNGAFSWLMSGKRCKDCYYVFKYGWARGHRKCRGYRRLVLPLEAFDHDEYGRDTWCRDCRAKRDLSHIRRHIETLKTGSNNRARAFATPGNLDYQGVKRLLKFTEGCCLYCGQECPAPPNLQAITLDHVVPFARGGSNYIYNVVPACPHCNSRKHDKLLEEFLAERRIGFAAFAQRWIRLLLRLAEWEV